MTVSLRVRITIALAAMGLVVLVASALVFYLSFRTLVVRGLEAELRQDAVEMARTIEYRDGRLSVAGHPDWEEPESGDRYAVDFILATDDRFRTLKRAASPTDLDLQSFHAFSPTGSQQTVYFPVGAYQVMAVVHPVARGGHVVAYILVGRSLEAVQQTTGLLKKSIGTGLVVVIVLGVGLTFVLARRSSQPILAIRRALDGIDLGRLDRRIALTGADLELRMLADTLNALFERLEQSYRKIDEFSSNVAHELQTPLTSLRGSIEVALSRDRQQDDYVEVLSQALDETLRISHIVESLLLLARSEHHSVAANTPIMELAEFVADQRGDWDALGSLKNQKLIVTAEGSLPVKGDPHLLSQLLLNLISNACKYSDEGAEIRVTVSQEPEGCGGRGAVRIAVSDHGIGIAEEEQERAFERFHRVAPDRGRETGGVGLGLAVCRAIVRLHGGTIGLTSALGRGTTVTALLPLARVSAGSTPPHARG